jgi:serine/threonine-protein kinase RsbW
MNARAQKFRLKIPSVTENLQMIREFVMKVSKRAGFDDEQQERIALAVDEACTNVIKHAHKFDARRLIDIAITYDKKKIKITIIDKGEGFDVEKLQKPNLEEYVRQSRHGGLGIYLMKTLMDEVDYEFKPGVRNKVELTKYIGA